MSRILSGGRIFLAGSAKQWKSACAAAQPRVCVIEAPAVAVAGSPEFVPMWEKSKGEFNPEGLLPRSDEDAAFECLVTATPFDADVAYALHARQIPVLALLPTGAEAEAVAAAWGAGHQRGQTGTGRHPLLTCFVADSSSVSMFLTFPAQRGRVFVIEGGDGAGKQTQVAMLKARLIAEGFPTESLDFPHDAAYMGVLIREVLSGQRGNIRAVSPLIFGALYGVNRHATLPWLSWWLRKGRNVILDRYMSANFGHQASKYDTDEERNSAIETLRIFETGWLDLPPSHRVVYLNLPPIVALRAMLADGSRKALDEHEKAGIDYKNKVRSAFLWCCTTQPGWQEIPCCEAGGTDEEPGPRISREAVHESLFRSLKPEFVNNGFTF